MVLNIDYDRWDNFFYNETLVNYVVWVIDRTKLETLLAEKSRQIVRHGVWRHVVSQSIDRRRIALKPAMPGASAGDNNKATTATKISNMELVRCVHRAIVSLPPTPAPVQAFKKKKNLHVTTGETQFSVTHRGLRRYPLFKTSGLRDRSVG